MNHFRKMPSLKIKEMRAESTLSRVDTNSEPTLRTLKDLRNVGENDKGLKNKQNVEEPSNEPKKLVRKKSYLEKIRENETCQ